CHEAECVVQCHEAECVVHRLGQSANACNHSEDLPTSPNLKELPQRGGARNYDMWTFANTEALLSLVKDNYQRLTNKTERNNAVWLEICSQLQEEVPGVTQAQVIAKWNNLKYKYMKYQTKIKTDGGSRMLPPQCFDMLDAILGDHHCTAPLHQISLNSSDSSQTELTQPFETKPLDHEAGLKPQPGPSQPRQSELVLMNLLEDEVSNPISPVQPKEEDLVISDYLDINIAGERRRVRSKRRLRSDTHSRRMEAIEKKHLKEVRRHNEVMERGMRERNALLGQMMREHSSTRELLRELADTQKQLVEELRKRGLSLP
ncbi:hypothetical protein SK128_024924, partial [Halocaridina rubra]